MTHPRTMNALACCILSAAMTVGLVGCGKGSGAGELAPVTGTVTYKGKPVKKAYVTFYPTGGGQPAAGTTDDEGKFELSDGAVVGEHKIAIAASGADESVMQPGDSKTAAKKKSTSDAIPTKYADPETSGLKRTVKSGENNFDIKLE